MKSEDLGYPEMNMDLFLRIGQKQSEVLSFHKIPDAN